MITEDSAKLLAFIYTKSITNSKEIIEYSGWDLERVRKAVKYLEGKYLIEETNTRIDGNIYSIKCSPEGIDEIELNKDPKNPEFVKIYNFTINLNIDSIFKGSLIG